MEVNSAAGREVRYSFLNKFQLFLSIPSWLFPFCALGSTASAVCYPPFGSGESQVSVKSNKIAEEDSFIHFPGIAYSFRRLRHQLPAHLGRPSVLPAGGDVSDDAGVALLAHVDAVHLDDALAWVETRHSCHGA